MVSEQLMLAAKSRLGRGNWLNRLHDVTVLVAGKIFLLVIFRFLIVTQRSRNDTQFSHCSRFPRKKNKSGFIYHSYIFVLMLHALVTGNCSLFTDIRPQRTSLEGLVPGREGQEQVVSTTKVTREISLIEQAAGLTAP